MPHRVPQEQKGTGQQEHCILRLGAAEYFHAVRSEGLRLYLERAVQRGAQDARQFGVPLLEGAGVPTARQGRAIWIH